MTQPHARTVVGLMTSTAVAMFLVIGCGGTTAPAGPDGTGGKGSGGAQNTSSGGSVGTTGTGGGSGGAVDPGTGGTTAPGTGGSSSSGGAGGKASATDGGTSPDASGNGGAAGGRTGSSGGATGSIAGNNGSAMDPGSEGDGDFTIGPTFTDAPEYRASGAKGTTKSFTMQSSSSAIYPSSVSNKAAFSRQIWVYTPNGYVADTEVPFMVVGDGQQYQGDMVGALDALIAAKKIPKMVAIFIQAGPGDGTGSERSWEYDKVSGNFAMFVETEILPKVAADYKIKFTSNPEGRGMMGGSSGGAMAFTAGWFRPDLFRRIITYSGTFVNLATDSMYPSGAWGYHDGGAATALITTADLKPLRITLECGSNDNGSTSSAASKRNWVIANQNMAKVLKAKGYHYRFVYANGAGHVDDRAIKQTLPDALVWLWRGYVAP